MATLSVKPKILILLEQSIEQMGLAIDQLVNNRPWLALIPEQIALEYLVKSTTKLEKILTQIKPEKKVLKLLCAQENIVILIWLILIQKMKED